MVHLLMNHFHHLLPCLFDGGRRRICVSCCLCLCHLGSESDDDELGGKADEDLERGIGNLVYDGASGRIRSDLVALMEMGWLVVVLVVGESAKVDLGGFVTLGFGSWS